MRQLILLIKKKMLVTAVLTLLTALWVFLLDGLEEKEWRNFEIIGSIFLLVFIYSLLDIAIKYVIQYNFLMQNLIKYFMFLCLFFVFGKIFDWYSNDTWLLSMIYTLPIFVLWNLMDLREAKKDVSYINAVIESQKEKKD